MKFEFHHSSRLTKIILLGELFLLFYLLYALSTHIYKNYQVDYHIKRFSEMNDQLLRDNSMAASELLYSQSDSYSEKMAKQSLGLVNPGEEVIVISEDLLDQSDGEISEQGGDVISKYYYLSNPRKWWKFFFEIDHSPRLDGSGDVRAVP